MLCPECGTEMVIDDWGGWLWTSFHCDHIDREATDEEIEEEKIRFSKTCGGLMRTEDKVPTLEQCKRLVALGVVLETEKYWVYSPHYGLDPWLLMDNTNTMDDKAIPAPDVAEIGELLSEDTLKNDLDYYDGGWWFLDLEYPTEAQARCAALIWLIENSHLEAAKLS